MKKELLRSNNKKKVLVAISGGVDSAVAAKLLLDEGYDVLIRDVSNLDFPSYHILIPGMSELNDGSDTATRADNTRAFISGFLVKPSLINKENVKFILASLGHPTRPGSWATDRGYP